MATIGTYVLPGQGNTFIQNHEASGNLIVHYSRDPKSYPLARYAKYQPVKKDSGLFLRIKSDESVRIVNSGLQDFFWADGNDRPIRDYAEPFAWEEFRTKRYDIPWRFGRKAVDQADFPIVNIAQADAANLAMVMRTMKAATLLQTEANWETGHYKETVDIDGVADYWDVSTVAEANIERSLMYALTKIEFGTFNQVKQEDLLLIMNPNTARRVAVSPEIKDFVKQQVSAPDIVQGKANWIGKYGLPKYLFGFETLVENTFRISTRYGASTTTKTYCLDDGNAFLVARPGAIVSPLGGPNFATVTYFFLEELTVEQKDDADNRRYVGHVVDDYDVKMTAPPSAFWFQNVYNTASS